MLEPLQKMAERTGVAVVSVTHFSKQGGGNNTTKALHRFMGSIAFTAAARMAFAVIEDQDNANRRLLLHVKNNLAAPPQGLAFTVAQRLVDVAGGSTVHPYIAWDNQPVAMTANEAMAADTGGNRTERDDAADFLRDLLADGPLAQKTIKDEAAGAGFSGRPCDARKIGSVSSPKRTACVAGGSGHFQHHRRCSTPPKVLRGKRVSTFAKSEHLQVAVDAAFRGEHQEPEITDKQLGRMLRAVDRFIDVIEMELARMGSRTPRGLRTCRPYQSGVASSAVKARSTSIAAASGRRNGRCRCR